MAFSSNACKPTRFFLSAMFWSWALLSILSVIPDILAWRSCSAFVVLSISTRSCLAFMLASVVNAWVKASFALKAVLYTITKPLAKSWNANKATWTPRRRSTAKALANRSTPPLVSIERWRKSVKRVTNTFNAGAKAATIWSVTPLNKLFSLVIESTVSSTPLAALPDMVRPKAFASPSIFLNASPPPERVLTKAAPSESNSLNAKRSLSDSFLTPEKASARTTILLSNGILFNSWAFIPSSLIAPLASPVPIAASAVRLVNRCKAISIVVVATPVSSAAYLSAPRAEAVVPILLAVLAMLLSPAVTVPKPFLVLSNALMVIFTFSAIFLTHYLEIGQPLVEMIDRHLLCFFDCKVEAISQRKQTHPRLIAS